MKEFLDHASAMYYNGTPIISDEQFDVLWQQYGSDEVGYKITDGTRHWFPMFSLQKCFDINDAPFPLVEVVVSPKLDGAAVSLLYVDGVLRLGLTRGDGKVGRDITDKLQYLVPGTISLSGIVQITGEVVCPSRVPNARNVASGSLNLKDMQEFHSRPLTFVAYDCQSDSGILTNTYEETMDLLIKEGFHSVTTFQASEYPTDGLVYRVNSSSLFREMGYTAHHPRGAFALKDQKEGVVTILNDVVWQVGKSGVVSPVAILEPVLIGDATVSKATLHNIEYIQGLNLQIGCRVEVIRSGEIIPRILRRVEEK